MLLQLSAAELDSFRIPTRRDMSYPTSVTKAVKSIIDYAIRAGSSEIVVVLSTTIHMFSPRQMICRAGYSGIQGARPNFWKRPLKPERNGGVRVTIVVSAALVISSTRSRLRPFSVLSHGPLYRTPFLFLFFRLLVFE
jgi:hypothetical protein